jgi:hypothetical protein
MQTTGRFLSGGTTIDTASPMLPCWRGRPTGRQGRPTNRFQADSITENLSIHPIQREGKNVSVRRKSRFGPGVIMILIVIGIIAMIITTGNINLIMEKLFSAYAFFILLIMVFEYLLIMGSDRSAIYKRKIEAAEIKRRDDLLAMREIEIQLVELKARFTTTMGRELAPDAIGGIMDRSLESLDEALQLIRKRI